jgi:hypothetical protein
VSRSPRTTDSRAESLVRSLPHKKAAFVEPMDCLPRPEWVLFRIVIVGGPLFNKNITAWVEEICGGGNADFKGFEDLDWRD